MSFVAVVADVVLHQQRVLLRQRRNTSAACVEASMQSGGGGVVELPKGPSRGSVVLALDDGRGKHVAVNEDVLRHQR